MRKRLVKYENAPALHMKLREQFLKSIRDVKSNGFTAPGVIPSGKNKAMVQYESIPERDMAYFLEFSVGVKRFVEQPVRIDYIGPSGKPAHYTPDFLVYFSDNLDPDKIKPTLFEVKTREILKKNWNELKPKFMAAIRYCDTKGWRFKIISEVELNTPYVENAKFLVPYMRKTPSIGLIENVMDALHELEDHATPAHIVKIGANDFYRKAELIPALWFLVATRFIGCELDKPLTMDSNVWYIKS